MKFEAGFRNIFFDKNLNYINEREFIIRVNDIREFLKKENIKRLALNLDSPYEFSCCFFAALSIDVEIVLLPSGLLKTLETFLEEYDFCLDHKAFETIPTFQDASPIKVFEDAKLVLFTSGSSGLPQKIIKTFSLFLYEIEILESLFGKDLKDAFVFSTVSQRHIYGLIFRILWPILKRRPIANFNIEFPEELLSFNKMTGQKILISSPAFFKRQDIDARDIFSFLFSSGGHLDQDTASKTLANFGISPVEVYGSTETGGVAYKTSLEKENLWTLFPQIEGETDLRGCLKIHSPFILDKVFQTNDLVDLQSKDTFFLKGRVDRIYKIEEKRVSLDEVEKKLLAHPEVREVYCFLVKDKGRDIIACLVATEKNSALSTLKQVEKIKELKQFLANFLERVSIPKKYRFVEKLPYNEQSKLEREKIQGYFNE